jgi:hypothetical protein
MSIKQQGGVFGRNPTFNDVTIEGTLTFDGDIDVNSDLKVDGDLDVTGSALIGTTTANTTYAPRLYTESALSDGNGGILIGSYKPSATFLDFSGGTPAVHRIANDGGNLYFETDTNQDGTFDTVGAHFTSIGNLAFASGKGIDFSATAGTGTSELFDDYEEGTWTPSQGAGLTVVGAFGSSGTYTKIGRQVTVIGTMTGATSIAFSSAGGILTGGLPFNLATYGGGQAFNNALSAGMILAGDGGSSIYGAGTIAANASIKFQFTYFV